jgi:hypothetical protein
MDFIRHELYENKVDFIPSPFITAEWAYYMAYLSLSKFKDKKKSSSLN